MLPLRFKLFLLNKYVCLTIALAGLAHLVLWWFIIIEARSGLETLILHYTTEFGVDLLGPWSASLSLPVIGFIFLICNIALAFFLYRRYPVLSYLLLVAAFLVQVMLSVAAYFIVSLNS